jgi:hypothetical protein
MDDRNRYAPSRATLDTPGQGPDGTTPVAVWRDGPTLVMQPGAVLPDRCVKCNELAAPPTRTRKLYWHHWSIYLIILLNVVIYVIVAMIVRKRATVAPGLCARHKRRRALFIAAGWIAIAAGLVAMLASRGEPGWILAAIVFMLAAIVAAARHTWTRCRRFRAEASEYWQAHSCRRSRLA